MNRKVKEKSKKKNQEKKPIQTEVIIKMIN